MQATLLALASWFFPGIGHGYASRGRQMLTWALVGVASVFLIIVSVWIAYVGLALRLACAIDAHRAVRRDVTGRGDRKLAAIAIVIGAIGFGSVKVAVVEGFRIPSSSMSPTLLIGDRVFADKLTIHWHGPERGEIVLFKFPCDRDRDYIKRVIGLPGDSVEVRCGVVYVNGTAIESKVVAATDSYQETDETNGHKYRVDVSQYRETFGEHHYDVFDPPAGGDAKADHPRDFPRRDSPFAPNCSQQDWPRTANRAAQTLGKLVETKPVAQATACEPQLHYVVPAGSLFVLGDNRGNSNDSRYWGSFPISEVIGRVVGTWGSDDDDQALLGRVGGVH